MSARRGRTRWAGVVAAAAALAVFVAGDAPAFVPPREVAVEAHPIPSFRIGRPDLVEFGRLRWIGGVELEGETRRFGGLSGLVVGDAGATLSAVADDGLMLRATILRDDAGRPTGLADARLASLMRLRTDGAPPRPEHLDAEGFDIAGEGPGSTGWISIETVPKLLRARRDADGFLMPLEEVPLPEDARAVRWSKGFEALAIWPSGPLAGRPLLISERPPRSRDDGKRAGFVIDPAGGEPVRFLVADDGFDITDATFAPDGDLWLMERTYTPADGVRARLRSIAAADVTDGATVDGPVELDADLSHQIDNMEALDIWTRADGAVVVSMLSDDNRSFMQRTVYLEFELLPRP